MTPCLTRTCALAALSPPRACDRLPPQERARIQPHSSALLSLLLSCSPPSDTAPPAMSSESSGLAPPPPVTAPGDRASLGRADSFADSAAAGPYVPPSTAALEPSVPSTPVGAYASPAAAAAAETSPFVPQSTNPDPDPEAAHRKEASTGSKEPSAERTPSGSIRANIGRRS